MNIGILGGGQLARMLILAGYPLGLNFRVFNDSVHSATADLAPVCCAAFDDKDALCRFADGLDVVTFEFENIPATSVDFLRSIVPCYPSPQALLIAQDRLLEKQTCERLSIPVVRYLPVNSHTEGIAAAKELGFPLVLKRRRLGYDGKGQAIVSSEQELQGSVQQLGERELIAESFIPFKRELSLIAAVGQDKLDFYPLVENEHQQGILRTSRAPASDITDSLKESAIRAAQLLTEQMSYRGILVIEFFETDQGLLLNEFAPRVHNSGHWTIEGATCSQFENHLRAICGLPLGSCKLKGFAAMKNLIGQLPDVNDLLQIPGTHFHSYNKTPLAGRKLGHVTLCEDSAQTVNEKLLAISMLC